MKKIAIIGVGGRTGTVFTKELQRTAQVLGIGREKEIEAIREEKIYLKIRGRAPELFRGKVIRDFEFPNEFLPDIIFLCVKNPVGPAVKYYYQKIRKKEKLPSLALSQNGLVAAEDAKRALKEVLGDRAEEVQIIRISLFNPIDSEIIDNKIYMSYSLPIRLAFGVFSGLKEIKDIKDIFEKSGIQAEEISPENVKNMEFSKLLTNLIGIPSAIRNLSIEEGFANSEIFREEIEILREYIKVTRKAGGKFLNFKKMPVKLLAFLIYYLPLPILFFFRKKLGKIINERREGKPKGNLDEIEYYNGEVVKLGKKIKIPTPTNEEIFKKVKLLLSRSS